jgi:hypothetical protein
MSSFASLTRVFPTQQTYMGSLKKLLKRITGSTYFLGPSYGLQSLTSVRRHFMYTLRSFQFQPFKKPLQARYLADVAPLIVHCMNDFGWEATYDPLLGVLLPEIPLSHGMERDGAISLCVASSHTHSGIYVD